MENNINNISDINPSINSGLCPKAKSKDITYLSELTPTPLFVTGVEFVKKG